MTNDSDNVCAILLFCLEFPKQIMSVLTKDSNLFFFNLNYIFQKYKCKRKIEYMQRFEFGTSHTEYSFL